MTRGFAKGALALAVAGALLVPADAHAQGRWDRYMDYDDLTATIRDIEASYRGLVRVSSLGKTDAGRDIWVLTIGREGGTPLDRRPALLVVANLEANRLAGSASALHAAQHLVAHLDEDPEAGELLDRNTVYVIPRANPDGAELVFDLPAYETAFKPYAGNAAEGGLNVRERGRDLNGDGLVTWMRVRDPEGTLIPDPDEPRLLRAADRARAERGLYRTMVEGIDPAEVDAYVPMGTDGVNLNQNFQHEYRYFTPHVGPHMVSEVESRALVDFVFDHPNIAAVLTFSAYDNLRSAPPERRQPPEGVTGNPPRVMTNLDAGDRPYVLWLGEQFREMTGLSGSGAPDEGGSFAQFAYFQAGLLSLTTPAWTLPAPEGRGGEAAADRRWLAWMDSAGVDGFVDWTPATHPQLGDVEVGGFVPNGRVNPPAEALRELTEHHAHFVSWLAKQLPRVEVAETKVEARGDGVWHVTAVVANEGYLPTSMAMGLTVRPNHPVTVRLAPDERMTVLTGQIQQQVPRIEGMGGRSTHTWLVQAPAGTRLTVEVVADRAGGTITVPVTLR